MRLMERLDKCPAWASSSIAWKREWFLEELVKSSPQIINYLRSIAPTSKAQVVHGLGRVLGPILTELQWRDVLLMFEVEADAEDIRETLVALGFYQPPFTRRRQRGRALLGG